MQNKMIDFRLEPTAISPLIELDSRAGKIKLEGRSTPENSVSIYFPLIDKIKALFSRTRHIEVDFNIQYFNTSSSKCFFDLFKTLKAFERRGAKVTINWYYEEDDIDLLETGEDYESLLGLQFNFVEIMLGEPV